MTEKTEAQPNALRLADHLESFRSFPDDLAAAAELRRQHTEIEQIKAGLSETNQMNEQLRNQNTEVDTACAKLEAEPIQQANRAASAEQQVLALTKRLDMANAMGNDARNQLAQLSARQAVSYSVLKGEVGMGVFKQLLNDYRQCLLQGDYSDAVAAKLALIAEYKQAASPTPPARKPLTHEQLVALYCEMYGHDPEPIDEFADVCRRVEAAHGIGATND